MRTSKKLVLVTGILMLILSTTTVKANIFTGGRSRTSSKKVYVWVDSSVGDSSYYNSIYSFGRSYWSNTGTSFQVFMYRLLILKIISSYNVSIFNYEPRSKKYTINIL